MHYFQVFMILAGFFSVAGLVMANPILPHINALSTGVATVSSSSSAMGAKASTFLEELAEDGIYQEAKCLDQNNCCVFNFTYVPCADDKRPVYDEKHCRPVLPTICFSNASPSSLDDPVRQSINLVNHGCFNVLDKHSKDKVCNQVFFFSCTTNIVSVELYNEPDCEGLSSTQKNTAGCHHSRVGDDIRSFKILNHPGLSSKREFLLGGALLNESDSFSTTSYLSQGNKASVTPAGDCFDKQTGAYILGCKVGRSEASAGEMDMQGINYPKRALEPSKSTRRRSHPDLCSPDLSTWTRPATTETRPILEKVNGIAMKFTETLKGPVHISTTFTGLGARSRLTTTKVTAPAASVGVAATVSF